MQIDSRMLQEGFHSHAKCLRWYAVHTRFQHEHRVAQLIHAHGLSTFLPLQIQTHRWSDRLKRVEVPLFSCYVFVHTELADEDRRYILYADGVLGLVGVRGQGTPIPDEQIDAVRAILKGNVPFEARNFLKAGQRVRIMGGALSGIEGIFQSRAGEDTLVISVDALQRSLSIRISGYEIKPL